VIPGELIVDLEDLFVRAAVAEVGAEFEQTRFDFVPARLKRKVAGGRHCGLNNSMNAGKNNVVPLLESAPASLHTRATRNQ
jgi:hypothetical protein